MRPIPKKLRDDLSMDPFYKKCIRKATMEYGGKITFEHALIYAGKQINEKFAILPVCEKHHAVNRYQDRGDFDKRLHEWVALSRLFQAEESYQEEMRKKYPRAFLVWIQRLKYLNTIYGNYNPTESIQHQRCV